MLLLLLVATLVVGLVGLWQWFNGWEQRQTALTRSRLEAGEPTFRRFRSRIDAVLRRSRIGRRLEERLEVAGSTQGLVDFVLIVAAIMLGVYLGMNLLVGNLLSAILAVGVIGGAHAYLRWQEGRRREEFVAQLPELARVLSNASSAGLALPSAVAMAANELTDPASSTLHRVVEELRLGQSVDVALQNLEARMPSREVSVLVSTLVIQQRTGGDVVTALQDMSETLEARKDLRREVKTLLAQAVATSYMVLALGVGSMLLMNAVSPGVIERMTQQTIGQVALLVGISLYTLGFFLIRRTTRIEV